MREFHKLLLTALLISLSLTGCNNNQIGHANIVSSEIDTTISITANTSVEALSTRIISHTANDSKNRTDTPIVGTNSSLSIDYKSFISSLDVNDINSIKSAINEYSAIRSDDKNVNDDLYRLFYNFYYTEIGNQNSNQENLEKTDETLYSENGLVLIGGEAGPFIHEKTDFIKSIFYDSVSEGVQKYIDLDNEARKLRGGGYIFEDALLTLSWNDLSDLIVKYEDYINQFPLYEEEVASAKRDLDFYIYLYTQCLDTITFSYMNGDSDNKYELHDSYLRFIDKYPNSKYKPLIKGYIEILKKNKFTLDENAKKYLKENGIEVSE